MAEPFTLVFGLLLVIYSIWGRTCSAKLKRVILAIGLAHLCSWGIAVWLASAGKDPDFNRSLWDAMLHLKGVLTGVSIGLIVGLVVQGDLFACWQANKAENRTK